MCLTSTTDNDSFRPYLSNCDSLLPNQEFRFIRKSNLFNIGKFVSSSNIDDCREIDDDNNKGSRATVFMNSTCEQDTWEILDSGIIRNVLDQKCIGNEGINSDKIDSVDCDSDEVESWHVLTPSSFNCEIEDFDKVTITAPWDDDCYKLKLDDLVSGALYKHIDNKNCSHPFQPSIYIDTFISVLDGVGIFYGGDDDDISCDGTSQRGTVRIIQSSSATTGMKFSFSSNAKCQYDFLIAIETCSKESMYIASNSSNIIIERHSEGL